MRVAVLGPLELDGGTTGIGRRDRVALEVLAVRHGSVVRPDVIAEAIWADDPPASWHKVVQGCVVRLRKALGPGAINTTPNGYRLQLHVDLVDHLRFEVLLGRARELLEVGEAERAAYVIREALALWRGEPLGSLADWAPGRVEAGRLVELRRDAEELLTESLLRAGRADEALGPALRLIHDSEFRERRWCLLALAQYQTGRQADALGTIRRARQVLAEELGLDPGHELRDLEEAILQQDRGLAARAALPDPSPVCPYLGLVAYDVTDAATYFGREDDVAACLRRIDTTGLLAVVGPSGSGKSSLVRAGLASALERDGRRVRVITPGQASAQSVAALLGGTTTAENDVLVVDQLEEVFALDEDSRDRNQFIARLVDAASRAVLIVALRADRLGEVAAHPDFAHQIEGGLYLLGAMDADHLRRAIEGPAEQAALRIEPGLVDLLVREVEGEPGALPMLSHVLRQTWEQRESNTLTVSGYAATGGIREAVAQSAERLFRDLTQPEQEMLRALMLRLVSPDDTGDPVRTRVPRHWVAADEEHTSLIERLVRARLVSSDGDTVEIAHESLGVAWPRLRSWLDDDVEGLRIMRHVAVAADAWDGLGRPESELYRGTRLDRATEWRARAGPDLTPTEDAFLGASTRLADRERRDVESRIAEQRRSNRRLRLSIAAIAALLVAAVAAGGLAIRSADKAERSAEDAVDRATEAEARRLGTEALRSPDLDRSLLLAVAGVRLHDSADTRANLLAALEQAPALVRLARTGRVTSMDVNDVTGEVVVTGPEIGVTRFDGRTLSLEGADPGRRGPSVRVSPDGTLMAASIMPDLMTEPTTEPTTGDETATPPPVWLLDADGDPLPHQLGGIPGPRAVQHEIAFSRDSRWIVVGLHDLGGQEPRVTAVWDLRAPAQPAALLDLGEQPYSSTISADGRTLFSTGEGRLRVTDVRSGETRRVIDPDELGVREIADAIDLRATGDTLAVGSPGSVVLVDADTMKPHASIEGPDEVTDVSFSTDGTRLAAGGDRLMAWDVSTGQPYELLRADHRADTVAFSPDGATVHTTSFARTTVGSWDLDGASRFLPRALPPLDEPAVMVRTTPDGKRAAYLWVGSDGITLRARNLTTGDLGAPIDTGTFPHFFADVVWSPDGSTLVAPVGTPELTLWAAASGEPLAERRLEGAGISMAWFSPDGRTLVAGDRDGSIHLLDAATLADQRTPISVLDDAVGGLEVSPDGRTVLALGSSARLIDLETGVVSPELDLGLTILNATFSPDGERLFVTGTDGEVGLLRVDDLAWIAEPTPGRQFPGWLQAFSRDGSRVATVADGRVGLWNGVTGEFEGAATVGEDGAVAFSDDGREIVVAGTSGSVVRWDLDPATWIERACAIAGRSLTEAEWRSYLPDRPYEELCPG